VSFLFTDNGSRGAIAGPKQRDIKAYFTTQNCGNGVVKDQKENNLPVLSSSSSDTVPVPLATTTSSSNSIFSSLQNTTSNTTTVMESSSALVANNNKAVTGNSVTPKSTKASGKENLSLSLKDPLINDLKKQFDQMKAAKELTDLKVRKSFTFELPV
jgi:hypothetical protein